MLKRYTNVLLKRPYFCGIKNNRQVRALNEIKLYENLILFNVYAGASSLFHVVSCPIQLNGTWFAYFEEICPCRRSGSVKRVDLSTFSVVPYTDGSWETEWCLLKTKTRNPKKMHINVRQYQPQYY